MKSGSPPASGPTVSTRTADLLRRHRLAGLLTLTLALSACWFAYSTGVSSYLIGVPTQPGSCSAGVDGLKAARAQILADQPGTTVTTEECLPSWDEPGRYVVATTTSAFSCDQALRSFARIYGGIPHPPAPDAADYVNYPGPYIDHGGMRYYLLCDVSDLEHPEFILSQEQTPRPGQP